MARAKSVILTPAEKKSVITNLKTDIKTATSTAKSLAGDIKAVTKAHEAKLKELNKLVAANDKIATAKKAELEALTAKAA